MLNADKFPYLSNFKLVYYLCFFLLLVFIFQCSLSFSFTQVAPQNAGHETTTMHEERSLQGMGIVVH